MAKYFIVPGLGNSGPDHWQTHFENSGGDFTRIEQAEWEAPQCQDWIAAIDKALEGENLSEVVLVAHSLGCATVAHWADKHGRAVKGAFLVGPSDLEAPAYNFSARGFAPFPLNQLPFPSIVIASTNDPWVSIERAEEFAAAWGSTLINIGDAGHINTDAGYGKWDQGLELLKRLG